MIELPIGVTRSFYGRLPYIGTSLVLSSPNGARRLSQMMRGRKLVNLELHGIDVADAEEDGLQVLRKHQPDLRKSAKDKLASLAAAINQLRSDGYEFVTLAQAAEHFS